MFVISSTCCSGGSGGGTTTTAPALAWRTEELIQTAAFAANTVNIPLTSTPADADAILVHTPNGLLWGGTDPDWTYDPITNSVTLTFHGNPPEDYPTTQQLRLQVKYPYEL